VKDIAKGIIIRETLIQKECYKISGYFFPLL